MKIVYFIKILSRHLLLLILVPILIALVVFFVTRKDQWSYQSETTIYTGVYTGYTVQQQATANAIVNTSIYDNLINLIRSRQTLEEVSVSLLAQHLLLNTYNKQYISKENFDELHAKVPADIMDIVKKVKRGSKSNYRTGTISPETTEDQENDEDDLQISENKSRKNTTKVVAGKKYHVVRPGETVYSIATKNGLSVPKLMRINLLSDSEIEVGQKLALNNNMDPPIESENNNYSDIPEPAPATQNRLVDTSASYDDYISFSDTIRHSQRVITDSSTFEKLVKRLLAYGRQNDYNFIYKLWNSINDRYYSISALQKITVKRVQNSDLIQLTYKNPDPGICQQTLVFLTKIFINNYKILRQNQTDAVIQYFKRQVQDATERLKKAENDLLLFNEKNKIINYYEQTKVISITKEELDVAYQNKQISLAASDAALKMIERKLEAHAKLSINTSAILRLRGELGDATMQISNLEIDKNNDSTTLNQIAEQKRRAELIKRDIKENIDRLYLINNSVEGLPLNDVLNAWLTNVIIFEESKAAMRVLAERRHHFQKLYEIFAPLGAEIKRIERLIGVTENEFLQLLHDLNLAKLRQQDDELSTNIKVVDPPYYPVNPIRSRSLLLVLISGVLGFFLILIILIALEFFDTSMKTPAKAEQLVKLKLAGVYPKISKQIYSVDIGYVLPRLVEILTQNIKLALFENVTKIEDRPVMILVISTRAAEGKTTIIREISRKLKSYGDSVLYLNHNSTSINNPHYQGYNEIIPPSEDEISYPIRETFFEAKGLRDITPENDLIDFESYKYIIVEIPSLINNSYSLEFIQQFDLTLLVARANRSWTDADSNALDQFKSIFNNKKLFVLNGIDPMYLDIIFGEVPKFRSKFHKTMKRILLFQFRDTNSV